MLRRALASALLFVLAGSSLLGNVTARADETAPTPSDVLREVFVIPKSYAQQPGGGAFAQQTEEFFVKTLEILVVLNWIALTGIQALLDPDAIFGKPDPFTGIRPMEFILHKIWLASRNVVNAIFAFVLLFGGLYLIFFAGGDAISKIKSKIGPFVLSVILVNFSWFFPRVIFDASSVLTSAVFNFPFLVDPNLPCISYRDPGPDETFGTSDDVFKRCDYVWKVRLFPNNQRCQADPNADGCPRPQEDASEPDRGVQIDDFIDIWYQDWDDARLNGQYKGDGSTRLPISGADAIVNGLAVNFAKLPLLTTINFQQLQQGAQQRAGIGAQAQAALQFFIYLAFHAIFSLAVGLSLLAFMIVLLARIGVLWLCIAFMPFIFVGPAMGKGPGELAGTTELNIWKQFLNYTFLPTLVAIPYAIGFTLVSQLYYFDTIEIKPDIENLTFFTQINDLQQLLWMIISIAVIWLGVFMFLEKDQIVGGIARSIRSFGQSTLKSTAALGLRGALAPLPGGKKLAAGAEALATGQPGLVFERTRQAGQTPRQAGEDLVRRRSAFHPQGPLHGNPSAQNEIAQQVQVILRNPGSDQAQRAAQRLHDLLSPRVNPEHLSTAPNLLEVLRGMANQKDAGKDLSGIKQQIETKEFREALERFFAQSTERTPSAQLGLKLNIADTEHTARQKAAEASYNALANQSHTYEQLRAALREELERLKGEGTFHRDAPPIKGVEKVLQEMENLRQEEQNEREFMQKLSQKLEELKNQPAP
jgi:hypothetical protein